MYHFGVQEKKKLRVIIDTDAACEADDQYAIVHALLTPRFIVKGIIAEQFQNFGGLGTVDKSYDEVQKLLSLMELDGIRAVKGAAAPLADENDTPASEGADLIIEEAMKDDEHPLFVLCQGAITNVAIALNKAPQIAERMTVIWIGGGIYPEGGWEYNLLNDYHAANALFRSSVPLWQVPMDCYSTMQISYAELQLKVRPCGKVGRYLFDEMQEVGMTRDWIIGEAWALGDSPVVGLALDPACGQFELRNAPTVNERGGYTGEVSGRQIRVYHQIDSRFIFEDFFAKLAINYGGKA